MYERFYNLSSRPFQLMPDPRLLFESRDHVRALSYLLYGLERSEGFVVITGDVGTGKTLLLQSLLLELSGGDLVVARVAMANLGAESVVPAVAAAFGLPYKDRGKLELIDALVARLQTRRGRGALLVVDEAQACSVEALEELRALANLQAEGQALIQVALIGQTELRDLLASSNMSHVRQRIVAAHHLQPLAADEVRGYIEHRLKRVDWNGDPELADEIFPRIREWTEGVPRRINMLMDRVLLFGYLEELHELTLEPLETVIGEFEQELGANPLVATDDPSQPGDTAAADDEAAVSRLETVGERLRSMEQALRNAVGGKRMEELLSAHRVDMTNRAVIDTELRLKCLEGVFADVKAGLHKPQGSPPAPRPSPAPAEPIEPSEPSEPSAATPRRTGADVFDIGDIRPAESRAEPVNSTEPDIGVFDIGNAADDGHEPPPSRLFFWKSRRRE